MNDALTPETIRELTTEARQRKLPVPDQWEQCDQPREWLRIRDEMNHLAQIYRETNARLSELRSGGASASDTEEENCWAVLALALDLLRDYDRAYCKAAGLESDE